MMGEWQNVEEVKPTTNLPIVMKGPSQHMKPHQTFYVAGWFEPEYRDPWRMIENDGIGTNGWKPTHWMYVSDLEASLARVVWELN